MRQIDILILSTLLPPAYRRAMNQTIEGAFAAHWKNLVAKGPKLAQYPKSFRDMLRETFEAGYMVGSTDRAIKQEAHRAS
jgi:hypothetical protein